jgi:hypothetical protein
MARILGGPPFSNQHGRTYQHPASWPSDTSGKIWNRGHARRHRCLARVRQMRQRVPASHARVPASRGRRLRRLLPVRRLRRTERHRCAAAGTLTQGGPAAHTLSTGVTRLRRALYFAHAAAAVAPLADPLRPLRPPRRDHGQRRRSGIESVALRRLWPPAAIRAVDRHQSSRATNGWRARARGARGGRSASRASSTTPDLAADRLDDLWAAG